jgi:hypothetical protein
LVQREYTTEKKSRMASLRKCGLIWDMTEEERSELGKDRGRKGKSMSEGIYICKSLIHVQ